MLESFHTGPLPGALSFVDDSAGAQPRAGSVMITAVKGSEDDGPTGRADLVVRAVETQGHAVTATLKLPVSGREISADFGAHQIRTFLVPADRRRRVRELDLVERDLPGGRVTGRPGVAIPRFVTGGLTMSTDPASSDARRPAQTRSPGMVNRDT